MLLAMWDNGGWQDLLIAGGILLAAYLIVMWVASLVWVYRDIQARTSDNFTTTMCLLIVVVFNLPGLFLYLILRPKDTMSELYDRRLEAEALLSELQEQATCTACRRKVDHDFVVCPYCRSTLRSACESCGKPMNAVWVLCPYCGAERIDLALAPTAAAATAPPSPPVMPARPKRASTATYTPPAPQSAAPSDPAPADGS